MTKNKAEEKFEKSIETMKSQNNFKPEIDFSSFSDSKQYDTNLKNLTFAGHLKKYLALKKIDILDKEQKIDLDLHYANLCRQVRLFVIPEDGSPASRGRHVVYNNLDYVNEQVENYVKSVISKQK